MALTLDDARQKKTWIADQISIELKKQFNGHNINVAIGLANSGEGYEFALRLTDLNTSDSIPDQTIIEFVTKQMQQLVPGSKPDVRATDRPY
jgi:hypothetical protein